MSKIILSIGIPVYNGERFIKQTLDSIIPQLRDDVEVVISDNCSTDRTGMLAKEYAQNYSQIRY